MLAKTPVWKDLLINFVAESAEITSLICLFTLVGINAVRSCTFPKVEVRNLRLDIPSSVVSLMRNVSLFGVRG